MGVQDGFGVGDLVKVKVAVGVMVCRLIVGVAVGEPGVGVKVLVTEELPQVWQVPAGGECKTAYWGEVLVL